MKRINESRRVVLSERKGHRSDWKVAPRRLPLLLLVLIVLVAGSSVASRTLRRVDRVFGEGDGWPVDRGPSIGAARDRLCQGRLWKERSSAYHFRRLGSSKRRSGRISKANKEGDQG